MGRERTEHGQGRLELPLAERRWFTGEEGQ